MGQVTFTTPQGQKLTIAIKPGSTVMEAAVAHEVPGIEAQCYGAGICGTCHVYAQEPLRDALPPISAWEKDMLDALDLARPESRLSCQIRFREELEGIEFLIPERQEAMTN